MYSPSFISISKSHFPHLGMFVLLVFLANEMSLTQCESSQTDSNSVYIIHLSCHGWIGLSMLKCPPELGLVNCTVFDSPFSLVLCLTFCWCYYTLNNFPLNHLLAIILCLLFWKDPVRQCAQRITTLIQLALADPHVFSIPPSLGTVFPKTAFYIMIICVLSLLSFWSPCPLKAGLGFSESCAFGNVTGPKVSGFSSPEGEGQQAAQN